MINPSTRTSAMKTKCLIGCTNEVIVYGLKNLLNEQSDMECVGSYVDGEVDLKGLIDRYNPDVLVIDQKNKYYPNLACLLPLVQYPDLVVIVLENDKNLIQIYRRGEMILSSNMDLIAVIRNRWRLIL
jgi:DNA-binding NarL/FixJ family response regulator